MRGDVVRIVDAHEPIRWVDFLALPAATPNRVALQWVLIFAGNGKTKLIASSIVVRTLRRRPFIFEVVCLELEDRGVFGVEEFDIEVGIFRVICSPDFSFLQL